MGHTCLQVSNDVDSIGLVSSANIATPSIVLDIEQNGTNVLPQHPRAHRPLHAPLQTWTMLGGLAVLGPFSNVEQHAGIRPV